MLKSSFCNGKHHSNQTFYIINLGIQVYVGWITIWFAGVVVAVMYQRRGLQAMTQIMLRSAPLNLGIIGGFITDILKLLIWARPLQYHAWILMLPPPLAMQKQVYFQSYRYTGLSKTFYSTRKVFCSCTLKVPFLRKFPFP